MNERRKAKSQEIVFKTIRRWRLFFCATEEEAFTRLNH